MTNVMQPNFSNVPAMLPAPRAAVCVRPAVMGDLPSLDSSLPGPHSVPACLRASVPLGYVIGSDQYFKRDDVGIIYQLNVVPTKQRGLIGATLIKAMFDRAAYGCRLFC